MSIEVRNLTKRFDDFVALDDVSLTVPSGELVALLGPSGSGKTTLLRVIAGLEGPSSGQVLFQGDDATRTSLRERNVGFVFQHYALFKHMTVFENVAFGLRVRPRATRPSNAEITRRVGELLQLVQLERLGARYPSQLSGGQRQRVALARALAIEPKVLLLDEPFGALDAQVRRDLRRWLRNLHDEIHLTSLFVTHDQEEALEVADRVVVMNKGRIEQVGSPEEVYHKPASPFVYSFLGNVNLFHGRIEEGKTVLHSPGSQGSNGASSSGRRPTAQIFVRPHLIELSREALNAESFKARVNFVNAAGPVVKVELRSEAGAFVAVELTQERYRELAVARGQDLYATPKQSQVFADDYSI